MPMTDTGTVEFAEERMTRVGEVELAYQLIGEPTGEPTLMIMGLGAQMIYWPDGLCAKLAGEGLRLVRFDNRDAGRSSQIEAPGAPSLMAAFGGARQGIPYDLDAMAGDTVGLMDALEIEAAHLVGASLGGKIAQTVAAGHPERVRSLASIMSTTGDGAVGQPHPEVVPSLLTPFPRDRDGYMDAFVAARGMIGSRGFPVDVDVTRDLAGRAFGRGFHPEGTARQFLAILASGDRTAQLAAIRAPTIVIHGSEDPLIDVSGGRATAAAIPGAELMVIEGMGHDMPRGAWPQIIDAIVENTRRAGDTKTLEEAA